MEWREANGIGWLEASLPGARAAFSTRSGGVSSAPFASLNLGAFGGDDMAAVAENRKRLAAALGLVPGRVAVARQVHGTKLATHVSPPRSNPFATLGRPIPEVDGHVTAEPDLAALVLVADCLPVALTGPGGVAMLHCGWRGLAGGIVARGVEAVGATDAAIGPGIGPCCYEVGEEVLEIFAGHGEDVAEGRMLDLTEVARRLLSEAGVQRIETAGICTSCEAERFFSHRRDGGHTGHQAGIVWLEEPAPRAEAG
jgi:YfiH family protein